MKMVKKEKKVDIEKELKRVKIESLSRNLEFLSDCGEHQRLFDNQEISDEDVKKYHTTITKKYGIKEFEFKNGKLVDIETEFIINACRLNDPEVEGIGLAFKFDVQKDEAYRAFEIGTTRQQSENILSVLLNAKPGTEFYDYPDMLLLGINLNLPQNDILQAVKFMLKLHQDHQDTRLTWVKKWDKYKSVWDKWIEYGSSARKSFPRIKRELKIPLSTVKSRWYNAYKHIYCRPYMAPSGEEQDQRFADDQEKALQLCSKCKEFKDAKCYKEISGSMEHIPCPEYLKIAHKSYLREGQKYKDVQKLSDSNQYKTWRSQENEDQDIQNP